MLKLEILRKQTDRSDAFVISVYTGMLVLTLAAGRVQGHGGRKGLSKKTRICSCSAA